MNKNLEDTESGPDYARAIKLSTAIRMLKVATKAVDFAYANAKGGDSYAQGSKLSQALYRADQLRRIIDTTSRELGLI